MTERALCLRPHHLLCLQNFVGCGYSDGFTGAMARIASTLSENPELPVRITAGADALCAACPNLRQEHCASPRPARFDAAVTAALHLREGSTLPWREWRRRAERASMEDLDTLCPGCQWLPLCQRQAARRRLERAAALSRADAG